MRYLFHILQGLAQTIPDYLYHGLVYWYRLMAAVKRFHLFDTNQLRPDWLSSPAFHSSMLFAHQMNPWYLTS